MTDVLALAHGLGGLRLAVLDERIALTGGEAQLGHGALAVEHAQLDLVVEDHELVTGASLYPHAGPGGELAGDVIDNCGRSGHGAIVALLARP